MSIIVIPTRTLNALIPYQTQPTKDGKTQPLSLTYRHPLQLRRRTSVLSSRANQPVVRILLENVCRPARHAAHRKERRKQINGHPDHVVRARGVEVDVRVDLLFGLHDFLDPRRHLKPLALPLSFTGFLRHAPQVRRAGIFRAIDTMSESRNLLLLGKEIANRSEERRVGKECRSRMSPEH